jgi:hypothetical protein
MPALPGRCSQREPLWLAALVKALSSSLPIWICTDRLWQRYGLPSARARSFAVVRYASQRGAVGVRI